MLTVMFLKHSYSCFVHSMFSCVASYPMCCMLKRHGKDWVRGYSLADWKLSTPSSGGDGKCLVCETNRLLQLFAQEEFDLLILE